MVDKEITSEMIIKAMEVCSNDKTHTCEGCPFYESSSRCISRLIKSALEIINHQRAKEAISSLQEAGQSYAYSKLLEEYRKQKAEIEKKDTEIEILIRKKHALRDEISELTAEVERLKAELGYEKIKVVVGGIKQAKTEAYREFAERLKDMSEDCTDWGKPYVLCKDIDWLLERIQEG